MEWTPTRRETLSALGAAVGTVCCLTGVATADRSRVPLGVAAHQAADDWLELSGDMYVVQYREGYESDAQVIHDHMAYARDVVDDAYPHTLDDPVAVQVFPASEYGRSFSSMYYDANDRAIRMMAPADNEHYGADSIWYKKNVVHEYVHAPQGDDRNATDYRNRLDFPSWVTEGFAEYVAVFETTDDIREFYLDYRSSKEALEHVRNGDGYLMTVTSNVYEGAMHVFRYLDDVYGIRRVSDVFGADVDTPSAAFQETLGITPFDLQREWLQWAEANIGGTYDVGGGGTGGATPDGRQCGGLVTADGHVDAEGVMRAIRYFNTGETVDLGGN